MAGKKTVPSITRQEFMDLAPPTLLLSLGGTDLNVPLQNIGITKKQFSTGSFGWYASGKLTVDVAGKLVVCQVSCPITVVGSKLLP